MARFGALVWSGALMLALSPPSAARQPAQQPAPSTGHAAADTPAAQLPATAKSPAPELSPEELLNEEVLRQQLAGKPLYLRDGYLDNTLNFDEQGKLVSHSLKGSYTLGAIEIEKVRLTKHKVELEGGALRIALSGRTSVRRPGKQSGPCENHAQKEGCEDHH
jgi:hypothetical protein